MLDDDGWSCMCGHEIDPETGQCIVWDGSGNAHLVPDNQGNCTCHNIPMRQLEKRYWYD